MPLNKSEERVCIIAPIGQDAAAMAGFLTENGFQPHICSALNEFCDSAEHSCEALLLTEEALQLPQLPDLLRWFREQPPWSELPVIILTKGGESRWMKLLDLTAEAAGSLTVLERPISFNTLLRSVQVAMHSRRRQYQVRDLLQEQQRQQIALRESEERCRTLIEQVKDYAIFRIDNAGRPVSWNQGVQRILGFEEVEFIGREINPIIFTPEDQLAGIPEQELTTAAEKGAASDDRWMRRKDGSRFFASGVTTGLRNDAGELIGFSKVFRDETGAKQTRDALAEARAALERHAATLEETVANRTRDLRATNEQLETFVYSIAHDLRNPLRTMIGYSQLLMDDHSEGLHGTAQHLLNRIQGSAEFMDKLLLDLLAFGRAARAEIELTPVDVRKAWDAAIFQNSTQIEQTGAQIETADALPIVLAHEATLGQVLANLLSNALKFVSQERQPRIRLWSENRDSHVRLWIQDNGLGIPASQHERIFRVFERLHGSRYQGTGIGLSIVRQGIERMNGRVGLESEPGKGTAFWIELLKC
ncbi:MAG TPA: ATP-binding protein [Verrucomicrobiae bacterium]|nr:ATP-binding protein [Verrucomicrobiae bacterium]